MAKRNRRRRLLGYGALAAMLVVGAVAIAYVVLRTSLPTLDGRIAVAGLASEVAVLREATGVPHIFAETREDAHFALGFVHAQDRLWQMETMRRAGAGRLSEILGPDTVDTDRLFRTLGLYRAAARAFSGLDDATQAAYEAYAAGVNAYLATRSGVLPPEFLILGQATIEPWKPADSLVGLKLIAWDLSGNWRGELLRARLAERLTAEQLAAFLPDAPGLGSNNWVVAGDRSVTGMPLLANDPHLGLATPGPFYLAHLSAPGLDVVGATLPGVPGVLLGHNDAIAWGFTNTNTDSQDLFIERPDPADPARYVTPEGSRPFATRREVIAVKDGDEVVIDVRETRHGPVISDRGPGADMLALAWTGLADGDTTAAAILALDRARNWPEFVAAARAFHGPQQNIVFADNGGEIGFYAPARVPIRKRGDGRQPVPGWSGAYDWDGFVPFDALPHALNPPSGRFVTANNRIVGDDYPYFITHDWAPGYRARRITDLIEGRKHSVASFRDIQADEVSLMARDMLPYLIAAEPASEAARSALAAMRDWDGTMARDRAEPLIFAAWYRELTRLIYADELGPLFKPAWSLRPLFIESVLTGKNAAWCENIATAAIETCADQAAAALDLAVTWLAAAYGADPADWRWGRAHTAEHGHAVLQHQPALAAWFGVRMANGGDPYTVNAGGYRLRDGERPFAQIHGPVYRAVYDLADLERSLFVISTGQSGNPLSPHYRDFAMRWRDHRPFVIPTDRAAVEAARTARLILAPK